MAKKKIVKVVSKEPKKGYKIPVQVVGDGVDWKWVATALFAAFVAASVIDYFV